MIKIYFSDIFGLHPRFLAHSSQNLWNFLNNKSNGASFIIFGLSSAVPKNTAKGKSVSCYS